MKLNQDDTRWELLNDRLIDIFKTRAEKLVFVKGDKDLEFSEWHARSILLTAQASTKSA